MRTTPSPTLTASTSTSPEDTQSTSVSGRPLTTADRCDACGAQAYLRVVLASGELLFCAHHGAANREALERQALFIQDETSRLTAEE